jgi:serine/threonine protein kinase
MLTVKPKDRITLPDLMRHPWINDGYPPLEPDLSLSQPTLHSHVLAALTQLGVPESDVIQSIKTRECNRVYATYMLLEMTASKSSGYRARAVSRTQSDGSLVNLATIAAVAAGNTPSTPHAADRVAADVGVSALTVKPGPELTTCTPDKTLLSPTLPQTPHQPSSHHLALSTTPTQAIMASPPTPIPEDDDLTEVPLVRS